MTHILAISGSLRKASYNSGLVRAAEALALEGVQVTGMALHGIPLYDGDVEAAEGIPAAVTALKDAIRAADGVLLVTPEYNNGIPGVFKNAVDWTSRPASEIGEIFGGKPVAIIGASLGGFGTILSQNHWLPVIRTLGMRPWFEGRLLVSRASGLFDSEGNLTDDETRKKLSDFVAGFAAFAGA
ncbi:NADPH-dependent FMN reductase [Hyphomonas oceanitis]|uniref:NADPH-dependent FMN reductase n=1 Tax=Hyphomonas oceanitis SCH89 TaxID=1280953 RepID=A0A059GBE7_9PROT|nr:NADPH-dependent FMN reductase [Hyphomonas oceanitis]KDA04146.1 NADPH-dependent FMN reductase [Hyphomonas oceanitis SCH89]